MLNNMIWIDRTEAQWRELPKCYGPWQSVYARFRNWKDESVLERVFKALSSDYDPENLSLDSTCSKVHQSVNGNKKRAIDKAVGRSRGGLNTKIHAIVDGLGNPVEFFLSPGNDHDATHAIELLDRVELRAATSWVTEPMTLMLF